MMEWWKGREPRERVLIGTAGILLAIVLIVQFMVLPLRAAHAQAKSNNLNAARTLAEVERVLSNRPVAQQKLKNNLDADAYRSAIVAMARGRGIAVSRVQSSGTGSVTIAFEAVSPQLVFAWLEDLRAAHGIEPSRSLLADDGTGAVRASIEFPGV